MTQRVEKKAVLVGAPNVGKSVLFNNFTGVYVTVSNYPGTTVDISRGMGRFDGNTWEIIDTPGLYSLIPITEEEQVTRRLLISERPDVVIHVIDAKNIRRMLNMTLQLLEAGLPVILDLNIMDEAERDGVYIKRSLLAEKLGIPVIATSAVYQLGLKELKTAVSRYQYRQPLLPKFSRAIEEALERIAGMLMQDYGMNKRMAALLMLQNDPEMQKKLQEEPRFASIREIICDLASRYPDGLEYALAAERQAQVDEILAGIVRYGPNRQMRLADRIDNYVRQPLTGLPLLCLVLYLGLYQFVGRFGAGFLVDCLDKRLFADFINPMVERAVFAYLPEEWMRSLILGDYGLFTLGVRYAVVIILPIVGTFFLAFALLEDCGYLPRLAMLVDGFFRGLGLNGRAVIPMTLGLGCGTMAVIVTRTLETGRERLLATFLLALTIPCSAQLGVVLALLSHNGKAVILWLAYITVVFVLAGWLAAHLVPGRRSAFYMELPPLRLPVLSNVLTKAYTRMAWYFVEILPVFLSTSLALWIADRTGILQSLVGATKPWMILLGLPPQTTQMFLFGFFRRDYGAAGLYDMAAVGLLDANQLFVAAVTLTLFVPCVAQFAVMIKERGVMASLLMVMLIAAVALTSGLIANWLVSFPAFRL